MAYEFEANIISKATALCEQCRENSGYYVPFYFTSPTNAHSCLRVQGLFEISWRFRCFTGYVRSIVTMIRNEKWESEIAQI